MVWNIDWLLYHHSRKEASSIVKCMLPHKMYKAKVKKMFISNLPDNFGYWMNGLGCRGESEQQMRCILVINKGLVLYYFSASPVSAVGSVSQLVFGS